MGILVGGQYRRLYVVIEKMTVALRRRLPLIQSLRGAAL